MDAANGIERTVLLVDDERDALDAYTQALRRERYRVDTAARPEEALALVRAGAYDAAVVDFKMPGMNGIELLRAMRAIDADISVVMVTGYATIETAVAAMKEGASDYLAKPFTPEELRLGVRKAIQRHELLRENRELRERLGARPAARPIVGAGAAMSEVRRLIARVAETDSTVLISGETGTGKELVAREIHAQSRRAAQPFITVDCAAIPAELLESEFFGHERGAFTGAVRRRKGSFELADGGTLFLDEIGNMSLELQARLLRALQEREIQPVGGERKIPVDVRIVAATNRNLKEAVRAGSFREDFYYRLNVIPLAVPPLRERTDDVPALVQHFLAKHAGRLNRRIERVDDEALAILAAYTWPGNVRELESAIERAMTLADGPELGAGAFVHLAEESRPAAAAARRSDAAGMPTLEQIETDYILEVLQATRWNRREASRILGISTVTLWRRIGARAPDDCKEQRPFRSETPS
ncbi:MAG: sigma-54-dependent Fis family transcriptional regulator [Candidatus Rokubacteria bacterium]|nr:sigma-54-dependent Fis family transcriptional regulator [Candidatus Rokubacteria bacterium]